MSAADTVADQLLTINTAPLQGALQAKCLQSTGPQAPPVIQLMSVADTMADQLLTSHTIHTRPNSTPKTPQEVSKVFSFLLLLQAAGIHDFLLVKQGTDSVLKREQRKSDLLLLWLVSKVPLWHYMRLWQHINSVVKGEGTGKSKKSRRDKRGNRILAWVAASKSYWRYP